jgi:hypothetical protein
MNTHAQSPTPPLQRTSSGVLAASGYASNSAATTSGPACRSAAQCSGSRFFCARGYLYVYTYMYAHVLGQKQSRMYEAYINLLDAEPNITTTYHHHKIPHQACSQRQGTLAAVLPPPLARHDSLLQDAAAVGLAAQEKTKHDVSTPHRQADRHAATRCCDTW